MKALVYCAPKTLEYREVPDIAPVPGEHLIRIEAVGICGSDMHAYLGHDDRRPAPLILGHEGAGTIIGGPKDGTRVTINPLVTCGKCSVCTTGRENLCAERQIISMPPREGAFAQFVSMPDNNLVVVPDGVPIEKAALAEPLAVSWHAARLALEAMGDAGTGPAIVLGGGAIGVAAVLALRAMGVEKVTISEPHAGRRTYLCEKFPDVVSEPPNELFPIVIDAVGLTITRQASSALAEPGGVIAHIGLAEDSGGLDIRRITLQEITFIGTYTYTAQDFRDTAQALFHGKLGALDWFEERPLSDGAEAFAELASGRVSVPKIVLRPWD